MLIIRQPNTYVTSSHKVGFVDILALHNVYMTREDVTIYLIGPWKVKVNGQQVEFNALTCIDTASDLVKLICVDNKTAKHVRDKFTQSWLCQYPRPIQCLHHKGGEFIGQNFQWLLEIFSIKDVSQPAKICNLMQSVKGYIKK
jgi:hypothetical protein